MNSHVYVLKTDYETLFSKKKRLKVLYKNHRKKKGCLQKRAFSVYGNGILECEASYILRKMVRRMNTKNIHL